MADGICDDSGRIDLEPILGEDGSVQRLDERCGGTSSMNAYITLNPVPIDHWTIHLSLPSVTNQVPLHSKSHSSDLVSPLLNSLTPLP
jgi:hypothetical protein